MSKILSDTINEIQSAEMVLAQTQTVINLWIDFLINSKSPMNSENIDRVCAISTLIKCADKHLKNASDFYDKEGEENETRKN